MRSEQTLQGAEARGIAVAGVKAEQAVKNLRQQQARVAASAEASPPHTTPPSESPRCAQSREFLSLSAALTFEDGSCAVFSQCLAGFEHSLVLELAGHRGAIRTWWAGAMDRTHTPDFELKLRRAGAEAAEIIPIEKSGEVFELEEQLRRLLVDVPARTPLVSARDGLPSLKVCLEIERALVERRTI